MFDIAGAEQLDNPVCSDVHLKVAEYFIESEDAHVFGSSG